ncbi:MAG: hypothetical protein ACTS5G_03580, partial [Burkholderiales bacterium]
GIVRHPAAWVNGGYREIQHPPRRYALIDLDDLSASCGFASVGAFQQAHRQWVEEALVHNERRRDERWSEAIAVGSYAFAEKIKHELALKAKHRDIDIDAVDGTCALREPANAYTAIFGGENSVLRAGNVIF